MSFKKTYNFRLGFRPAHVDDEFKRVYDAINAVKKQTSVVAVEEKEYKEYVALISQISTGAPTATVIKNDLGVNVTWGYVGVGVYTASFSLGLPTDKTIVFLQLGIGPGIVAAYSVDTETISVFSYDSSGTPTNGIISDSSIIIRCYL